MRPRLPSRANTARSSAIADKLNKADFEAKKADALAQAEQLAAAQSGEYAKDVLGEQLKKKIEALVYEPQTDDAKRDAYKQQQTAAVESAIASTETETKNAQAAQDVADDADEMLEGLLASGNYSDSQKAQLADIVENFKENLKNVSGADAEQQYKTLYDNTVQQLNNVPVGTVTSGDIKADGTDEYPEDQDENKLWGIVTNDAGMQNGTDVTIEKSESDPTKDVEAAVENGKYTVAEGSDLAQGDLKDLLDGKEVIITLNITLSAENATITEFNGIYTVKVLLPEELREVEGLTVVSKTADGIEVHETSLEDGKYLVFTTSHFSEFIVLGGGVPANMWWLVITLTVVLFVELVALLIVLLKGKKKGGAEKAASVLPVGLLAALIPAGTISLCVVLGIAVIAAGIILFLVIRKSKKSENK